MPQFNAWFKRLKPSSADDVSEYVERSIDRKVKLAVTGLSRSGKTVFITSLIHQLLHGLEDNQLPFFNVASSGRLRGAKIIRSSNMHIPAFRYDDAIDKLCGNPPTWPHRTEGISEIRLAIRYRNDNLVTRHVNPINTMHLDIIDYPGEWLLDLPLLELSYEDWSDHISKLCEKEPRLRLSQAWRDYLNSIDLNAPASDTVMREASRLYTDFLLACKKTEHNLSLLQPGHFTMPGQLKDAPVLEFCPLLQIPSQVVEGSVYAIMRQRYEYYKEHVVRAFYRKHFASFDRQIVLVDVLRAFNTGYATFADMREALNTVLQSFAYGKSGFFYRLFHGLKIDRVLFAATKADHVTPNQLPNLEHFINQMLIHAQNNATFEGVSTETLAIAAVKCTQAATANFQGQKISCIKGVPKDGEQPVALFPGEIPVDIPRPEDWIEGRFNFVEFKPPRLADAYNRGLPHIRMDKALEFLLGDKF